MPIADSCTTGGTELKAPEVAAGKTLGRPRCTAYIGVLARITVPILAWKAFFCQKPQTYPTLED
jgi:hypothetical protein